MCGFFGISIRQENVTSLVDNAREAISALSHRGPDAVGFWSSDTSILAHARLSIIDLEHGHQPMHSADGSKAIIFNGQIFNYKELRSTLKKLNYQFKTRSDTEVILAAYEHFGERCLDLFHGMFAFVIFDQISGDVFAARDRFGIKPLYYSIKENFALFGSEAKAFYQSGLIPFCAKQQHFNEYLIFGHVAGEETLHGCIDELEAGHYLHVTRGSVKKCRYYELPKEGSSTELQSEEELVRALHETILSSVDLWTTADTELSLFLSGGIDSTLIAAMASRFSKNLDMYTLFLPDYPALDESSRVSNIASNFPGDLHCISLEDNQIIPILQKIYCNYNEPIPPNSIVRYALSNGLRQISDVKVALCGDGADEIFGGYQRHGLIANQYSKDGDLSTLNFALNTVALPRLEMFSDNVHIENPTRIETASNLSSKQPLNQVLELDVKMYLAPYLHSMDRMGMMFGLEFRPPFLDHKLVEFAMQLPPTQKIKGRWNKYILRKVSEKYLPEHLSWNPQKIALTTPVSESLERGALADLFRDLVNNNSRISSYYDVAGILRLLAEHRPSAQIDHSNTLFRILALELWLSSSAEPSWL